MSCHEMCHTYTKHSLAGRHRQGDRQINATRNDCVNISGGKTKMRQNTHSNSIVVLNWCFFCIFIWKERERGVDLN